MTSSTSTTPSTKSRCSDLMNEFSAHDLRARLAAARESLINPLLMRATDVHDVVHIHHAINEVALFRSDERVQRPRPARAAGRGPRIPDQSAIDARHRRA